MSTPIFPTLPGQGWGTKKTPMFNTRIHQHVNGREVRSALASQARYQFELTLEHLDENGAWTSVGYHSLQQIMGLYVHCKGPATPFLYKDPSDCFEVDCPIGTGDGATKTFTVSRTMGLSREPVSHLWNVFNLRVAGVVSTDFTIVHPNTISFRTAPDIGQPIVADIEYYFRCRFEEDRVTFENMMLGLWSGKSIKFRSLL